MPAQGQVRHPGSFKPGSTASVNKGLGPSETAFAGADALDDVSQAPAGNEKLPGTASAALSL